MIVIKKKSAYWLQDNLIQNNCKYCDIYFQVFYLDMSNNGDCHVKFTEIKDIRGLDVFGQVPMKKQFDCVCPNCQRNLAASRFAPHLEKCMGMGRNSSRIASRR